MTYLNALPAVESRFGSSTSTYSVIAAGYTIAGVRTPPDGPTRKSKPRPCIVLAQSSLNRRLRTLTIELGGSLRHLFRTGRLLKIYVNIECENERRRCVVCRQRGALAAAAGGHVGGRAVRVRAGRGRGRRLRAAAHARAAGAARRRAARRYRAPPAPALPARPARHTLTRPGGAPGRARPPGSAPAAHASSPSSSPTPAAPAVMSTDSGYVSYHHLCIYVL